MLGGEVRVETSELDELLDDERFVTDPYPAYRLIARHRPLWRSSGGSIVVTSYRLADQILRDHTTWGQRVPNVPAFQSLDPPDHTRLRRLVMKAFTPRAIAALERRIEEIVTEQLDATGAAERFDVTAALSYPLPTRVITAMLGVPDSDSGVWTEWTTALHRHSHAAPFTAAQKEAKKSTAAASAEGVQRELAYMRGLVGRRSADPGPDIISSLIAARADGDKLSEEELILTLLPLLNGGIHTSSYLIARAVLVLIERPDLQRRIRADRTLLPRFINEVLRFDPPVHLAFRRTRADVEIGGERIAAGTEVLIPIGLIHRDREVFDRPDEVLIDRTASEHIAFGLGIHYCLGAPLARAEAQVSVSMLLDRYGYLGIDEAVPPRWHPAMFSLREMTQLGVVARPRW
jgi:cytochrome P450